MDDDNNRTANCITHKIGVQAAQPVPQFPSNERMDGPVQDAEYLKVKPPKRKRCGDAQTSEVISERGIHSLTERQRRNRMNQFLSNMHSFLLNQITKVRYYPVKIYLTSIEAP